MGAGMGGAWGCCRMIDSAVEPVLARVVFWLSRNGDGKSKRFGGPKGEGRAMRLPQWEVRGNCRAAI